MFVKFDPVSLCRVLNEEHVDYVVVGGIASVILGSPLPTEDIDLLPDRSGENLERRIAPRTSELCPTWSPSGTPCVPTPSPEAVSSDRHAALRMADMTSPRFRVQQMPTARDWLAATESLRGTDPVLTNVPGSVAQAVAAGARYDSELWLIVVADDEVLGCAMRTAPWPVFVGPMPHEAARLLGEWLQENAGPLSGMTGSADTVASVALGMERSLQVRMRETVRVLDDLVSPAPCEGSMRPAVLDDRPLLVQWFAAFHREANLAVAAREEHIVSAVHDGRLWLWEDGSPVAMGGHAQVVTTPGGTVGRIGPIYTVPGRRKHGYGSAMTHAIAMTLASSCDTVMLFADAENAASNGIYERLGFAAVAELVEVSLE